MYLTRILRWGDNFQVAPLVEAFQMRERKLLEKSLDKDCNISTDVRWSLVQFSWGNIEVDGHLVRRLRRCTLHSGTAKQQGNATVEAVLRRDLDFYRLQANIKVMRINLPRQTCPARRLLQALCCSEFGLFYCSYWD